jgi:hypothetical protein
VFFSVVTAPCAHPVSMAGHRALWEEGVEHGDISIGKLMCDPVTKQGILNNFDLARLRELGEGPSGKENTGSVPFVASDLLNRNPFKGMIPRIYRHDAESSFAQCLIYICICTAKHRYGRDLTIRLHPLSSWFQNSESDSCLMSKETIETKELLKSVPLHKRTKFFAHELHTHWFKQYYCQIVIVRNLMTKPDPNSYIIRHAGRAFSENGRKSVFRQLLTLVDDLYSFLRA